MMARMTLELTPRLQEKLEAWCREFDEPPEALALGLLDEYFDDCDDADRLSALIETGEMETHPWEEVKARLAVGA